MAESGEHDIANQRLAEAMGALQRDLIDYVSRRGDELQIPSGIVPNVVLSTMAFYTTHLFAPRDWRATDLRWEEATRECVRRMSDACFSMKDYVDRKTPWRAQSKQLRELERQGGRVLKFGEREQ